MLLALWIVVAILAIGFGILLWALRNIAVDADGVKRLIEASGTLNYLRDSVRQPHNVPQPDALNQLVTLYTIVPPDGAPAFLQLEEPSAKAMAGCDYSSHSLSPRTPVLTHQITLRELLNKVLKTHYVANTKAVAQDFELDPMPEEPPAAPPVGNDYVAPGCEPFGSEPFGKVRQFSTLEEAMGFIFGQEG